MKEDKLEKIIKENREFFDDKKPSGNAWKNIAFRLNLHSRGYVNMWWRVAAIVFFAISSVLMMDRFFEDTESNSVSESSQFTETENFYLGEIHQKTELITQLTDKAALGEQAERDLQRLDVMYRVLKEEYQKDPSKEVVDALILNLLLRMDILNDELERLDQGSEPEVSI